MTNSPDKLQSISFIPEFRYSEILIIEYRNVSPHLETGLEIHDRWPLSSTYVFAGHLLSGNEGYINPPLFHKASEIAGLQLLTSNSNHNAYRLEALPPPEEWLVSIAESALDDLRQVKNIDEIKSIKYRHLRCGMAFASQLISHSKSLEPDLSRFTAYLEACHSQYFASYSIAHCLIKRHDPTALMIFNGRFAPERALSDAAKYFGISTYFHEQTYSKSRFFLAPYPSHDFSCRRSELELALSSLPSDPEQSEVLDSLFIQQRTGHGVLGQTFSSTESSLVNDSGNRLIDDYKSLLFCTSSDDEFSALDEVPMYPFWESQKQAILAIMTICHERSIQFILRVHPNISNKSIDDQRSWLDLCALVSAQGATSYDHTSTVSTYDLMKSASFVVTSGSMTGIEAMALGKRCAVIRECTYSNLPGVFFAPTLSKFKDFLCTKVDSYALLQSSRAYAFWALQQGLAHTLLAYDSRGIPTFKGHYLRAWHYRYYALLRLKRLFQSIIRNSTHLLRKIFSEISS